MDTVDITSTPEACRQIARLFRAQKADAAALASRAARALDALDAIDDDALAPWGRALLAAAFAALHAAERARVRHMDEGLEAVGPYANATDGEGSDDAA
jgi:DnaJ-domain-containing protein 1